MNRKKNSAVGTLAGLGHALDETFKVAADAATARLGKTELQDWYNDRLSEGSELAVMARDRAAGITEPLRNAAGMGRDLLEGVMAPSSRTRRRRPTHGRRTARRRRTR
jgi:hypothetical protein